MRKVRFLIVCLFVLCSLPLNAQPPKPRRATESKVIAIDPYLKWFQFLQEFGPCSELRVSVGGIFLAGVNGPVLPPYPDPNLPTPDLSKIKSVKEVLHRKEKIEFYELSPNFLRIFILTDLSARSYELWHPYRGQHIGTFTIEKFGSFNPPGSGEEMFTNLLSTSTSKIVELRDTRTGKRIRSLTIPDQSDDLLVDNFIFSPDGQRLAMILRSLSSRDVMIELWNPHNGKRIRRITVPKEGKPIVSVNAPPVFSPDGRILVVGIERSKSFGFGTYEDKEKKTRQNVRSSIEFWSSDGKRLATAELQDHSGATSLVFSPDEKILAGAMKTLGSGLTKTIFLWNPRTGEHIRTLTSSAYTRRPVFSPDGKIIAPSDGIDEIPLWNPHTGKVIKILKHNVKYEDFPDEVEISSTTATKKEAISKWISEWKISHFTFGPGGRTAAAIAGAIPVFWEISPSTNNLAPPKGAQLPPKERGRTVSPPISPNKPVPPKETDQLTKGQDKKVSTPTPPAEPLPPKGMVLIPAGPFMMGSVTSASFFPEALPPHSVNLDAFYIDRHEVTVGEYKKFVEETNRQLPPAIEEHSPTDEHPIVSITWQEAMAYAKWAGKRLPTEAEWEKAARGPKQFEFYPWETKAPNDIDDTRANYGGVHGEILPVGSFDAYGYRLHDMAGNVSEWCMDHWSKNFYTQPEASNPNPFAGSIRHKTFDETIADFENVKSQRVVRGGTWDLPELDARVDARTGYASDKRYRNVGFRCAKDAQ